MVQENNTGESARGAFEAFGELLVQGGMVCLSLLPFVLCIAFFVQARRKGKAGWKLVSVVCGLLGILTLSGAFLVLELLEATWSEKLAVFTIPRDACFGQLDKCSEFHVAQYLDAHPDNLSSSKTLMQIRGHDVVRAEIDVNLDGVLMVQTSSHG